MKCRKCEKTFPISVWIDGKKRNLQKRKFCLECSPFGLHNTRPLDGVGIRVGSRGDVVICRLGGKTQNHNQKKGEVCWTCQAKNARHQRMNKLTGMLGGSCWICGYNKCTQGLDFHHMRPEEKSFQLSAREMQYAWERIWNEVQKCCLICCRCHREVHAGLIQDLDIIYEERWEEILGP